MFLGIFIGFLGSLGFPEYLLLQKFFDIYSIYLINFNLKNPKFNNFGRPDCEIYCNFGILGFKGGRKILGSSLVGSNKPL